ncbi:TetR/AcrR family transcriptional regulator [Roseococcus sp. YIM B11640]|uniref:TetR/AcrR family transcriptional regulator n=1 Tax=Roseococcus sp. YIM B11640 TaxID=3133973 RepID=UPI003C7C3F16
MRERLPQPAERSPKYQAILNAAGGLFLREGYAAVAMDAIAREAGVSKATLYGHFTGKDALFGAVVAERCAAMIEQGLLDIGHEIPVGESLRRIMDFWLRFMLSPGVVGTYRIVLAEGGRFPDLARAFFEAGPAISLAWVRDWMAEEQRRGRLRPDFEPQVAATQFFALLRGALYVKVTLGLMPSPTDEQIAAEVEAATDTLLRAFAAP